MRQQALQFIAAQAVERALRHSHDGVILVPASGKGVDACFVRQHHDLRRLHARGNRQLADNVAQTALGFTAGKPGFTRTSPSRELFTSTLERRSFEPPAAQHEEQHQGRVDTVKIRRIAAEARRNDAPGQRQRGIDAQQQRQHRQAEQQQQAQRLRPGFFLLFKKMHAGPHGRSLRVTPCPSKGPPRLRPGKASSPAGTCTEGEGYHSPSLLPRAFCVHPGRGLRRKCIPASQYQRQDRLRRTAGGAAPSGGSKPHAAGSAGVKTVCARPAARPGFQWRAASPKERNRISGQSVASETGFAHCCSRARRRYMPGAQNRPCFRCW